MTESEAIEKCKFMNDALNFQRAESDECSCALEMAIQALEKQIPKQPNYEADGYADGHLVYDTWICPCCGKDYEVDYDNYDYCPNCGQHIDWRNGE